MAYIVAPSNTKYFGLSTDAKPVLSGVSQAGAKLVELDTGLKYYWSGSDWVQDLSMYLAVKTALEDAV